jgi:hypothetical protein
VVDHLRGPPDFTLYVWDEILYLNDLLVALGLWLASV